MIDGNRVKCPVCLSADGYDCTTMPFGSREASLFDCEVCGKFAVSGTALDDHLDLRLPGMTKVKRAALSHQIKIEAGRGNQPRMLTTYDLELAVKDNVLLPTPAQQANNIIRFVGDIVSKQGELLEVVPKDFSAIVGSPSREFAFEILAQLDRRGLMTGMFLPDMNGPPHAQDVTLTLDGWELYENERRGRVSGSYGFIALKFGDNTLDPLMRDHIKPAIKSLGYEAVDMRDVSQAGIIDNLLRVQIRDSAFVIVDLTHDNAGAYWEAGYAEGIGKPVLYICEKSKFDEKNTHFDTNHCTTVPWDLDNLEDFLGELKATLKRSLNV